MVAKKEKYRYYDRETRLHTKKARNEKIPKGVRENESVRFCDDISRAMNLRGEIQSAEKTINERVRSYEESEG
jgi:hypothetical protein